jgi:two-component system sensor histidine kinase UhpB
MMITTAQRSGENWSAGPLLVLVHRLQQFWYRQPVRTQILTAFFVLMLVASFIAGLLQVLDARSRAKIEMRGPVELAESFVRESTSSFSNETDVRTILGALAKQLQHLRHVRVQVIDNSGQVVLFETRKAKGPDDPDQAQEHSVPRWFTNVVRPASEIRSVPIMVSGEHRATVIIHGEPADEIAEVWNGFRTLAILWLGTNLLLLAALYVVLGRILDPLVGLADAMRGLEHGNFAVRFSPPKVRELRLIAARFNQLAAALNSANAENSRLCRDLISVQEEERRQIASELHDEVGPCLFGIMVNASSLQQCTGPLPREKADQIASRIGEIGTICDRLKSINRRLLKKLRPVALGRVTVKDLITTLSNEFEDRHADVRFLTITNDLQASYGELIDLTIYRCIQEGITNALRHAKPSSIVVELTEERSTGPSGEITSSCLRLVIRDNGEGINDPVPIGFGLATMRERVKTLNGTFSIRRNWPSGTAIDITIPTGTSGDPERKSGEPIGNRE